jgi:allophanate hydrolase
MSARLLIHDIGPSVSLQDLGRPGYRSHGLMIGGAADPVALLEAAALLGQKPGLAALEMVGVGGTFETSEDRAIALTGGRMDARIDGAAVVWNACHTLPAGAQLQIGGAREGSYGYLSIAGGIDTPVQMGARARHGSAALGPNLAQGDSLPLRPVHKPTAGQYFDPDLRFTGGTIRIVASMQTSQFAQDVLARFTSTTFKRDARANRMGVRMDHSTDGFFAQDALSIVSEVIAVGDIQITGDGAPYVLMCECQTTGGYPRIGTVIPSDLPKIAQAPIGAEIRFEFVSLEQAISLERAARDRLSSFRSQLKPLVRNPADMPDLLSYQLVSGAVSATADPFTPPKGN